jgi:hypothetical protein
MYFVLCLILDYWEIKHVLLLIFLLIVHHANLAKVKFYLFLIMHLAPHNVLILFIMMFRVLHPLFLMSITSTLLLLLMSLVTFTWVYFLRAKTEVFSVFKCFLALLETQFSASIKVLHSDSGSEYMSNEFHDFFQSKGIMSPRSCPSTP